MTTATKAASITTNIRRIESGASAGGASYTDHALHGEPRVLKKRGGGVRFALAGRTFFATLAAWNRRGAGFIEAVEV